MASSLGPPASQCESDPRSRSGRGARPAAPVRARLRPADPVGVDVDGVAPDFLRSVARVLLDPVGRPSGWPADRACRSDCSFVPQGEPQGVRLRRASGRRWCVIAHQVAHPGRGAGVDAGHITAGVQFPGPGVQERKHRGAAARIRIVVRLHVEVDRRSLAQAEIGRVGDGGVRGGPSPARRQVLVLILPGNGLQGACRPTYSGSSNQPIEWTDLTQEADRLP